MIVIRNVFRLKFGKAREMRALWDEWMGIGLEMGSMRGYRTLVDLTGESYTFVLETEFDDLASYEQSYTQLFATPAWRSFYSKVTPLVESGHREIYSLVDVGTADVVTRAAAGAAADV